MIKIVKGEDIKRGGRQAAAFIAMLLVVTMIGCDPVPPASVLQPATHSISEPALNNPPAARISGIVETHVGSLPVIERHGAAAPVATGRSNENVAEGDISLNFVDTDIREILRSVLGGILKVNYIVDSNVQGNASVQTNRPISRTALLPLLDTVVAQVGAVIIPQNGAYRIALATDTQIPVPVTAAAVPGAASQIVPLRYASARQLAKTLAPYVNDNARIVADEGGNVLVITGSAPARQSVIDLIHAFDIDLLAGQSYVLLPVRNVDSGKLASELTKAMHAEPDGAMANLIRIVPIEQASAILIVSPQQKYVDQASRIMNDLDRIRSVTQRHMHVYFVQNGSASDLENVLRLSFTPESATNSNSGSAEISPSAQSITFGSGGFNNSGDGISGGGSGASGAPGGGSSNGGSAGGGGSAAALGNGADAGFGGTLANTAPTEPLSTPSAAGKADQLRIVANKKNNALIIYATESEYEEIEATLRKIDILPMQVLIEATIAEVTLNDNLRYGTQYFLKNSIANVVLNTPNASQTAVSVNANGTVAPTNLNVDTFLLNHSVGGIQVAIEALSAVTNVQVLSAPNLLVLDSERARLQVGDLVPIISQSSVSTVTANAPIVNSVEYRETGVILTVSPRISTGGLVTLDIEQEVSTPVQTSTSNIQSPSFTERRILSRVAVQDGETVGLGGLISDSTMVENNGIPFLKDIPVINFLFSSKNNQRARTELLVLLTPHVIRDQRQARILTEALKQKLNAPALIGLKSPPLQMLPNGPVAPHP